MSHADLSLYHRPHKEALTARLSAFSARLPPSLGDATLAFGRARRLPPGQPVWDFIYFFLPFWAQMDLGRPVDAACHEIAYANACLSYAVLIQDELMDESVVDTGPGLMAANAYTLEGHLAYASLFPASSPFWPYFAAQMQASWDALLAERQRRFTPGEGFTEGDVSIQKAKVSALRVAVRAVVLSAGQHDATARLERYVDEWQMGCQGDDDFLDWEDDLRAGVVTRFLVAAGACGAGEQGRNVVRSYLGSGRVVSYFDLVAGHYRRALEACADTHGPLHQFIERQIEALGERARPFERIVALIRAIPVPSP